MTQTIDRIQTTVSPLPAYREPQVVSTDWRERLPMLRAHGVTIRELRAADAATLCRMLSTDEVTRFISPPPTTVEGFERFIAWTVRQRAAGSSFCYGIVPDGYSAAVGLIQVRALDAGFTLAEWGFAIGSPFWGTGLFLECAKQVIGMTFDTVGVDRLEARAAIINGRGHGALRKLGAVEEALLRKSFHRHGEYHDQVLWSILAVDWTGVPRRQAKTVWGARIH
jgi:ribosomal-protein-serine acetyltransferase